jgi:small-conductance mechanosensitive channel
MSIPPLIENLMMTVAVGVGGLLLSFLLIFLILRRHERRPIKVAGYVLHLRHLRAPLRLIMPPIFMRLLLPLVAYSEDQATTIQHVLQLWIIAALGAFAHSILVMVREMLRDKYPVDVEDNLEARRVMTQFRVVERILTILIVVVALSAMLMTFESVRQFGVSLLASAGILGIVLGFAAQQSLGTLLAGIQIAMSQPIRLDDVVIVEGEWGRVEEITLTYVVVRIWDERRLIVPITYFPIHRSRTGPTLLRRS